MEEKYIIMSSEIRPKACTYGCGVEIYWNTEENSWSYIQGKNMFVQTE
ncbi:MAG TPA: hypothetical protein VLA74_13630 [Nitrososphaeraceae archaeon]|nr:hypothetical protein [Nitrososphaeraceae archaeon]